MAFLLPSFKKSKQNKVQPELDWKTQGQWYATQHDGFKFALLTGDFNPIHWISLAGKLSAFKMKVLHGFGMFVRSYEQLPLPITSIEAGVIATKIIAEGEVMHSLFESASAIEGKYCGSSMRGC